VFYTILKPLNHKFMVLFLEHGVRKFWFAPKIGRNLCSIILLHFLSDLQFKSELSEEIQLNKVNLIVIANTLIIVSKLNI
jgi:hypothetical protein